MNSIWYELFFEVKVEWKTETEAVKNICFSKADILEELFFSGPTNVYF